MKKLSNVNLNELLNKGYENLSEEELMILALKGAIQSYNSGEDVGFWEAFITTTFDNLKNLGWTW